MRRKLEFAAYAILILFFILRYADMEPNKPRMRAGSRVPSEPAIILPDSSALPRDIAPSVTVELDSKVQNGVGTAFAVDDKGTYVTARHVVDGCREVYLVAGPRKLERVRSHISERTRDFAVIEAARAPRAHFQLTNKSPRRGDEGYMMGFPQGNPADVRATVIGRTEMRSSGRYRMREPVIAWVERERRPGFTGTLGGISGGPVFDSAGNVIGTVVAGAPRRGRVYSTHPQVFDETGLRQASTTGQALSFEQKLTAQNFDNVGKQLRAGKLISQVYCKAT